MRLLLASKSATRRRMLEAAGVPFGLAGSSVDEEEAKKRLKSEVLSPERMAQVLADKKALGAEAGEGVLVVGSDQVLETPDGGMLDKPGSPVEAHQQLRSLSGRTHRLHSAAAIAEAGKIVWRASESVSLTMRSFSDRFLEDYLEREYEAIRWSVGGYHVEGVGVQLFEAIEGSHFAILGMPLLPLLGYLRDRGVLAS